MHLLFPQVDNQFHDVTWESIKFRIIHVPKVHFVQKSKALPLNCLAIETDFCEKTS